MTAHKNIYFPDKDWQALDDLAPMLTAKGYDVTDKKKGGISKSQILKALADLAHKSLKVETQEK